MGIGKIEVILLIGLLLTLLFVGGKKLPELARGIGEAAKELKNGFRDDGKESGSNKETTDNTIKDNDGDKIQVKNKSKLG